MVYLCNRAVRTHIFLFLRQIPQLYPFITETVDEWLKPAGVNPKRSKSALGAAKRATTYRREDVSPLEALLPPKDDTDALVTLYLDHFEYLHRIVHIPTFQREYASSWTAQHRRDPALTALVLSMISISTCAFSMLGDSGSVGSRYRTMPAEWTVACDDWLEQQSPKYRKLIHYQVWCLIYLAKRMSILHKKRFWTDAAL